MYDPNKDEANKGSNPEWQTMYDHTWPDARNDDNESHDFSGFEEAEDDVDDKE